MVRENQTIVRMNGWDGGYVPEIDDVLLEIGQSPSVLNVDIGLKGEIVRRPGWSKYSASDPAGMSECMGLYFYSKLSTVKELVYIDKDADVWDGAISSGVTFAQSTIAGPVNVRVIDGAFDAIAFDDGTGAVEGAAADNQFFLTSATSGAKSYRWDGTTWVEITDHTLNDSGSEFPLAATLAIHADRIFAGSVGTVRTSLMHFSNAGDGLTWAANDNIVVDAGDQFIRKLIAFHDTLLILKDRKAYVLSGLSPDTFNLRRISDVYGTLSPRSVVDMGDKIVWYDDQNGVVSFDGSDFEVLDLNVRARLKADADISTTETDKFRDIWAYRRQQKYYISFETGNPGRRTYVYDFDTEAWSEYDYGLLGSATNYTDNIFTGGQAAVNTKGVWEVYKSSDLDDATTLITSTFKTPWFSPEADGSFIDTHRLLKMIPYFAPAAGPTPVNVVVDLFTDFNNNTVVETKTVAVDESNSDQVDPIIVEFENNTARAFQIKFTHATAAEDWQLNAVDFLFYTKPTVSGVR